MKLIPANGFLLCEVKWPPSRQRLKEEPILGRMKSLLAVYDKSELRPRLVYFPGVRGFRRLKKLKNVPKGIKFTRSEEILLYEVLQRVYVSKYSEGSILMTFLEPDEEIDINVKKFLEMHEISYLVSTEISKSEGFWKFLFPPRPYDYLYFCYSKQDLKLFFDVPLMVQMWLNLTISVFHDFKYPSLDEYKKILHSKQIDEKTNQFINSVFCILELYEGHEVVEILCPIAKYKDVLKALTTVSP